jgi:blue copper oxidase
MAARSPSARSRRQLLAGLAAASGLWLARRAGAQGIDGMAMDDMPGMASMPGIDAAPPAPPQAFTRALPVPAELRGVAQADGSLGYALTMQPGSSELVAGLSTPSWGYNGAWLGPALRLPRGRAVDIALHNALPVASTTHWHGAHVPGGVDGGPQQLLDPGQSRQLGFTLDQPGATLWFHPHPDGRTGAHVWAGLAGLLLVDDGVDARLGLPRTWGVDDLPLVLQDRRLDDSGRLLYMPGGMRDVMGMKGDRFLVNGCERPYVELPAQWVRLRVLNGSNARLYNLVLGDAGAFHVVASDAGLLQRPVEVRSLLLAPGERAEIMLDLGGRQGQTLLLRSDSGAVVPGLSSMPMDADAYDRAGFDLLQIRVGAPNARPGALPRRLVEIEPLRPDAAPPRRFMLQGMPKNAAGMAGMAGMAAGSGPGGMGLGLGGLRLFPINDAFMDMARIDQRVRLGATEVWEIGNDSEMAHPFHMHGTSFQIAAREGAPAPEHERGWKDVVLVRPRETVRVVARFGQPADAATPYMFHCHILEHEDNGMMGQFTVS